MVASPVRGSSPSRPAPLLPARRVAGRAGRVIAAIEWDAIEWEDAIEREIAYFTIVCPKARGIRAPKCAFSLPGGHLLRSIERHILQRCGTVVNARALRKQIYGPMLRQLRGLSKPA